MQNLDYTSSDHYPILLETDPDREYKRGRRFQFENAWLKKEGSEDYFRKLWMDKEGSSIRHKLVECAMDFGEWSPSDHLNFVDKIKNLKVKMRLARQDGSAAGQHAFAIAKEEFHRTLAQRGTFWEQRAKAH